VLTPEEVIDRIDAVDQDAVYKTAELFDMSKLSAAAVGLTDGLDLGAIIQGEQ
jgi:hypothetical protein